MEPRRQAVRDRILRTAADLFRERGYRAATLDEIAARLAMSKASLYGYFHAKEDMLAAISRETIEGFTRELALVQRSDLGPEEKLRRVVRQHVRFVIANRSFLTVFFSEEPNLPPRIARVLAAQKDRYDKGVEAIVSEGCGAACSATCRRAWSCSACSACSTGSTSGTTPPAAGAPRRCRRRSSTWWKAASSARAPAAPG
jgi:AcrR family transcriptional regulator